jgi:hypothetical protein
MLYGQWLNRCTRVKPVLLTDKPSSNFVEANITWETSVGLSVPTQKRTPHKGTKKKGEQVSAYAQDKLANRPPLVFPTSHASREQFLPMSKARGILAQM